MSNLERPKVPFVITNGSTLFTGGLERVGQLGYELNDGASLEELVGAEYYPFQSSLLFWGDSAGVSAEKIQAIEADYGVPAQRIHIEFASDQEELKWQASGKNNQHNGKLTNIGYHKILYTGIKDAASGFGIDLARDLGIGLNAHTNVFLVFFLRDELERLNINDQCLIENTINYNIDDLKPDILSLVNGDRRVLFNPVEIVRQLIEGRKEFSRFKLLYARDHLMDYFDRQQLDPNEPAKDPRVQKLIVANHLTGPIHTFIKKEQSLAEFVHLMETSLNVPKPIQYVFDYSPIEMVKYARSLKDQVLVYRRSISLVRDLQQAVVWYENEISETKPPFYNFAKSLGIFGQPQLSPI